MPRDQAQIRLIELSAALAEAPDAQTRWDLCVDAFHEQGVTGLGYGMVPLRTELEVLGNSQAAFFRHTYPQQWADLVRDGAGLDYDPSVQLLVDGAPEILWHEIEDDCDHPDALRQFEVEADLGMVLGVSLALRQGRAGRGLSGVGLWVRDMSERDFTRFWQDRRQSLVRLSHLLDETIARDAGALIVPLSDRERDCLSFLAVGLRPDEIAFRLRISPKTLEKHITTAKVKLRARTRDNAVVKALMLGAIAP